jgi:hypothetical protein
MYKRTIDEVKRRKALCCFFVALVLREDIEHLSMLLHRSPRIVMKLFKDGVGATSSSRCNACSPDGLKWCNSCSDGLVEREECCQTNASFLCTATRSITIVAW